MIDLLQHDVRSAFRSLWTNPAFTCLTAMTMAAGIGVATSMFSIVDAVLLRALPFPNADTLVLAGQVDRRTGEGSGDAAPANFLDWRARNQSLTGLAAYRGTLYALSSDDHPELIPGAMVSASFFDVLGVKPLLGRAFRADDEGPNAPRVAIISAAPWRQRVGGLLLIATLNVSGLLLARATGRRHEMAVRVALGASRSRIVFQLLTESLLLALVAGGCGIVLAMWLVPPLATLAPYMPGFNGELHADVNVLAFAFGTSVVAGIVFGLAPARQLVRTQVHDDLKQAGRGSTGSGQRRVRAALVATEIAMALVLLVGSGLTIKSFVRLQSVPAGFEPDRVLTLRVALPQ